MKTSSIVAQSITARLQAAIGLDPGALDPGRLRWIIRSRCRHLELPDSNAYADHLEATPAELDALIDEVVVQETRFFRDPTVFDHIRAAIAQFAAANPGPLRILSAPCGTGQEAYSLAATLQLAGLPADRFTIDAVDISLSALEIARRGVYPERALAHLTPEQRQACAHPHHKLWHVHQELRERVHFDRRNLAEPGALGERQYHLILCRNLFIYLAPQARTALAQSLSAALVPGGRLFLGTADRVEELNALFSPVRPAASFSFVHRRQAVAEPAIPARRAAAPKVRAPRPAPEVCHPSAESCHPSRSGGSAVASSPPSDPTSTASDLLKRALEHRQRGELAKAERRCRQALYLDPNLLPALELLQLLWDQNPNLRLRRALRDRILRNRLARPIEPASAEPLKETA
jgi:chemotaxis protein methyltransferase WspC